MLLLGDYKPWLKGSPNGWIDDEYFQSICTAMENIATLGKFRGKGTNHFVPRTSNIHNSLVFEYRICEKL